MDNYNQTYYYLFNRITDLIEEMKSIQQTAEELFITFFLSVMASIVAYYVCKWLDRND